MGEIPKTLERLLSTPGPSGYEAPAAAVWREAAGFAELAFDGIGSTIATIGEAEASPLVAVVGHIDEIGLVITHVDEKGFVYFGAIGGWDAQILVGQRVEVQTKGGPVLGVVGRKAIHVLDSDARKKAVELKNLHMDIGVDDRDRALELVRIGDPVVIATEPRSLDGSRLISRSMDNRLGAYVALESLRRVHERGNLKGRMAGIASVQEEIGLNGAGTSAFASRPDVAVAIDVCHATDAPGMNEKELGSHALGSGPCIGRGSTLSPQVYEMLCETAERLGIEYTVEGSGRRTGTDADAIQVSRSGIPTGLVSVPLRYMHSPVEMVDLDDLEQVIELVAGFAESLEPGLDLSR